MLGCSRVATAALYLAAANSLKGCISYFSDAMYILLLASTGSSDLWAGAEGVKSINVQESETFPGPRVEIPSLSS